MAASDKSAKPANTQKTGKRGGKTSTSWKPGQSGNPKGPPARGESWRELIAEFSNLDGPTVAERAGFLAAQFRKMPGGTTLKQLVVLRVFAALIDDPQPGLLNAFMERVEGKVPAPVQLSGPDEGPIQVESFDYAAATAAIAARSNRDSDPSGAGEDHQHGAALGEDDDGG